MKILHINSYFNGGTFYRFLYDRQVSAGKEIDVYVPVPKKSTINMDSYPSYTLISKCFSQTSRFVFHWKHKKIFNDVIKRYNFSDYNFIHSHSLFSNGYIAYKINKKYNVPYIVAVRNTDVNIFFRKMIFLRKLGVNILKGASAVVFLSDSYKELTISNYVPTKLQQSIQQKSVVIPNGIDDFWFDNQPESKINHPGKKLVNLLYVGRIDKNKNIETTIKACLELIRQGYSVKYKIIGRLSNEYYSELVKKYGFIDHYDFMTKDELLDHYRSSDIFVMPSFRETFGLVYPEAMSQGLPVIYTRGQGFDRQFEDGEVGFSVDPSSPYEISEKIQYIINDYSNISNNCIDSSRKFDWKSIEKEYEIPIFYG